MRTLTDTDMGQPELGANWRVQFADADGIPLNMVSFEVIDFGAISYREIFQNVKTILATPLYSAALERTLGIDQTIVDLPIDAASQKVVAILDAIYRWEPRVEVVNIDFDYTDTLAGHLQVNLQLKIKNVYYGTDTPYSSRDIGVAPQRITQVPPVIEAPEEEGDGIVVIPGPPGPEGPQGPPGSSGPAGARGSLWFTGATDPVLVSGAQAQDMYLNTTTAAIFQYDGTTWRVIFNGVDTKGKH